MVQDHRPSNDRSMNGLLHLNETASDTRRVGVFIVEYKTSGDRLKWAQYV